MKTNYKQVIRYLRNFYHNHIRDSFNYDLIEKISIKQDFDYVIETIRKCMKGDDND